MRRRRAVALLALVAVLATLWLAVTAVFPGVDTHGARVVHFTIDSNLVRQTLTETAVIPPGNASGLRPLLVFLHGKSEDEDSNLSEGMFSALARLGPRAPIIVFPDGGEDSYWHDRAEGAWGSYLMREVIPQALRRFHADPRRVAIGGLSMGGFGAYDLARLYPGRFCAVGGDSAALWRSGGESAQGAFDSGEDFARHDVIGAVQTTPVPYPGAALWLDVGSEDPFRAADTELAQILRSHGREVQFHVWPGGHDQSYWSSHWNSYLPFYADALAHCHQP